MTKNIILAHGIFGFGNLPFVPFEYFNGVAAHLRQHDYQVIEPQVNPVGSIQQRATQLASEIANQLPAGDLHIIAHSMGGLDARYLLANDVDVAVAERIRTLVTIGTPHRGSPVADAILKPIGNPLAEHIPRHIRRQLENLQTHVGGAFELTTEAGIHFDESTPDREGVLYIEVAGNAALGRGGLVFFDLAAKIGHIGNEINDGVVTKSSALRQVEGHIHLPDWPVDHAGEVGWDRLSLLLPWFFPPSASHLARYHAIAKML